VTSVREDRGDVVDAVAFEDGLDGRLGPLVGVMQSTA
jgi:hypothetical protein